MSSVGRQMEKIEEVDEPNARAVQEAQKIEQRQPWEQAVSDNPE
jgi:hypothetical protein